MIIETASGKIDGIYEDGLYQFRGVPFASAKRFQKPQLNTWRGVIECKKYGYRPMQEAALTCGSRYSEDCLNLNIFTPSLDERLPVVITVYGGAFQRGSNSEAGFTCFVKGGRRFVHVGINYRLGIFGYLHLEDYLGDEYSLSGNCGLMDQMIALKWVRDNIEHFGGDPENITLIGQSAGGKSIGALMVSPHSKELFHKAILSSGSVQTIRDKKTAGEITRRLLEILALDDVKDILTIDGRRLLEAQIKLCSFFSTCFFGPVADGTIIPLDWQKAVRSSKGWKGSAVIGSARNESYMQVSTTPDFLSQIDLILHNYFGDNDIYAKKAYQALTKKKALTEEEQKKVWLRILSDFMYRTHSDRLADILAGRGQKVWQYSFEFLTAAHGLDYVLFWNNLKLLEGRPEEVLQRAEKVSETMYEFFTSFILNGDPNCDAVPDWKPSTKLKKKKLFVDDDCTVVDIKGKDTLTDFPDFALQFKG